MKILVSAAACCPGGPSEGGVGWSWLEGVARAHDVHLLTLDTWKAQIEETLREHPELRVTAHYIAMLRIPGTIGWIAYYIWQWRVGAYAVGLHRRIGFDLCHNLTYFTWRVPSFLWRLGVPFVWGPIGGGQRTPRGFSRILGVIGTAEDAWRNACQMFSRCDPFVRHAMRAATVILCANRSTLTAVPAPHSGKCRLMWETAVGPAGQSSAPPEDRDARCHLIWAGRILPFKGLPLLLGALHRIPEPQRPKVTVIGDGPDRRRCERLVSSYQLQDTVRFSGWMTPAEAKAAFGAADMLAFTSLRETSGNVVLEAMAAGLPVITLDWSGPGELVTGDCGIKIPVIDPVQVERDLAAAITMLGENPTLRASLAARGRARVAESFRWRQRIDEVLSLYGEIAQTQPQRSVSRRGQQPTPGSNHSALQSGHR